MKRPLSLVSISTDDDAMSSAAEALFQSVKIRRDGGEDFFEACVNSQGRVIGASSIGLYDETPDDGDDLKRPRYLFSIAVDRRYRRRGIARMLIESLIRAYPREKFLLEGKVVNPNVVGLLKELGFYYAYEDEHEDKLSSFDRQVGRRMYRPNPRMEIHMRRNTIDDDFRTLARRAELSRAPSDIRALISALVRLNKLKDDAGLDLRPSFQTQIMKVLFNDALTEDNTASITLFVKALAVFTGAGTFTRTPEDHPNVSNAQFDALERSFLVQLVESRDVTPTRAYRYMIQITDGASTYDTVIGPSLDEAEADIQARIRRRRPQRRPQELAIMPCCGRFTNEEHHPDCQQN